MAYIPSTNMTSTQSLRIFTPIADWLVDNNFEINFDFFYGIDGSSEWTFKNGQYFYDFTMPIYKLIFEFNGSHVHPSKERLSESEWNEWRNPFNGQTADEKYKIDLNKINYAKNMGYDVIEIWDYDDIHITIEKLKKIIMKKVD